MTPSSSGADPWPDDPQVARDPAIEPVIDGAATSRRGLLHGLTAVGAMGTVGAAAAGLVSQVTGAPAVGATRDHHKPGHKHKHKHRHRHRHRKTPSPSPTVPSSAPTVQPPVDLSTPATSSASSAVPVPVITSLVDDGPARNLISKFSAGLTPALAAEVQSAGGAMAWFSHQLSPNLIADDAADATFAWWGSLGRTPSDIYQRHVSGIEMSAQVLLNYERWVLAQRILSKRHVLEVMTDFWENHLNVPTKSDAVYPWRTRYGLTIRQFALGRFDDLLFAAVTHPAMLTYLNGAVSTKTHPNENLGRELLELHTVGRGQFGEDDVKNSARILTGWHVDLWRTWARSYQTGDHYVGPVQVMDFVDPNASSDGQALTQRYLSYLAHHPATARRIAAKLAVRFCSDTPSDALVDSLAAAYLAADTDIRPVLQALVASPEFIASAGAKVRNPCEDVVATFRALGVQLTAPTAAQDHVSNATVWLCDSLGALPHDWPQPNGQPIDNASWASPSRMLASLQAHWSTAGGYWPKVGATYRAPVDWLPAPQLRLDALIESVCLQLLVRRPDDTLMNACLQAVGYGPAEVISASHPLVRWNFARLLSTLLDSPAHMTR